MKIIYRRTPGTPFDNLGVEEYEVVATLDAHTSEICQSMDGKHFQMKNFQAGVTAPPFHPWCRSTTCPWFADDFGEVGERAARGEDGKTYYIPADMTYGEWEKTFVESGDKSGLKAVDKSGKSDIMKENSHGSVKTELHSLGTIDIDKYKSVTDKKILTNEVIITDNRIEHIIQRRGKSFYDEYHGYFEQIVKDPDYIFKDIKENTAIVSKCFIHKGKTINLVLRLVVEGDDPTFKNSIITAVEESERRFAQRLRNNDPIYKKVDTNE